MTELLANQLEKVLIEMGEDAEYIAQLKITYIQEHKENYLPKYISHLKEIERKYYGGNF